MKSLIKLLIIFFALAFSFLLEPSSLQAKPIDSIGSIQRPKTESVVLVSNLLYGGEVYSNNEENSQVYSGSSPVATSHLVLKDSLAKNITQLNGCFIHNLSTDKQKVQQIRAP